MDSCESLFDMKDAKLFPQDQGSANLLSPNMPSRERGYDQRENSLQNDPQNSLIESYYADSQCEDHPAGRNQKLIDFDENDDPYYGQNDIKEDQLSDFLGRDVAEGEDLLSQQLRQSPVRERAQPEVEDQMPVDNPGRCFSPKFCERVHN